MASVHVNRINRPNTWLHRPMLQKVKKVLANTDPGASSYETRYRTRVLNNLHRHAKVFGFFLQPLEPNVGAAVS
jgi:hypothetical protein